LCTLQPQAEPQRLRGDQPYKYTVCLNHWSMDPMISLPFTHTCTRRVTPAPPDETNTGDGSHPGWVIVCISLERTQSLWIVSDGGWDHHNLLVNYRQPARPDTFVDVGPPQSAFSIRCVNIR
jgi:hypothetical protein